MNRSALQPGFLLALATLTAPACAVSQAGPRGARLMAAGSLSGVIRDAEGVPQMGALVEAVLGDSSQGATAITNSRGQYSIMLRPGSYRIRASAALLLPAVRERLQIAQGTRAVVNLTLSTVLAPGGWLPASKRTAGEPGDEWMWTLRSSASRSILRLADPGAEGTTSPDGTLAVSSSREESRRGTTAGRLTVKDSEGGFAQGGSHNVLILTRLNEDGSGAVLRADLSGTRSPFPVSPSAEISVGLQRRTLLNGQSRAVLTYSSHPELVDGRGHTGLQGATLRTAQRMQLGDLIRIDVGSVLRSSNLGGSAVALQPFLRVAARPGSAVEMMYTMTSARGTESLDDLDRVQPPTPIAFRQAGRLRLESGTHHALSITGALPGGGVAEVAAYHDRFRNPSMGGAGSLSALDLHSGDLVADPTTRTFRVVARGYTSAGLRLSVRQPITHSLQAGAEVSSGRALKSDTGAAPLQDVLQSMHPVRSYAATAFLDGKVLSTGTAVHASYRWQPKRTVTLVDGFRAGDDVSFLSCSLRQSLGQARLLPRGLEAVLDLRNLLSEGYQPFLSSDGSTLFLAQTPRTLQAGLSFSF